MRAVDLIGGTEIIPESDCWGLLATQQVGRIGFVHEGRVEIFPVNYSLDGTSIVFRTNAGRKMAAIWSNDAGVVFEVDLVDPRSRFAWSVVVHGTARDITDQGAVPKSRMISAWAGYKDYLIRITPDSVTGRRVAAQQLRDRPGEEEAGCPT